MTRTARWLVALLPPIAIGSLACGSGPVPKAVPAATVANPVKEADLATITLTPDAERRLGIETAVMASRPAAGARQVGGEVLVPPGRIVLMTAPTTGRVEAGDAALSAGARVKQGQVVLRLTPLAAPTRDLRVTYEAEAAAARARDDAAKQQLDRARQLLRDRAGSQKAVEQAEQESTQAKAALDAATARLGRLSDRPLDADVSVPVAAPFDAVVRDLSAGVGQTVGSGAPLFELADLRRLWVRVPVYVGEVAALQATREVTIDSLQTGAGAIRRTARRVDGPPSANPQAASADLYFEFDNPEPQLRPGQRVGVSLPVGGPAEALSVPVSAVVYDYQGGAWMYVNTAEHTYVRRRVDVARTAGPDIILARGPAAGSRIVTQGAAELFGTEFGAGK